MAYKNQKKNRKHQAGIRKANSHKKHERKKRRSEADRGMPVFGRPTEAEYRMLMHETGLI